MAKPLNLKVDHSGKTTLARQIRSECENAPQVSAQDVAQTSNLQAELNAQGSAEFDLLATRPRAEPRTRTRLGPISSRARLINLSEAETVFYQGPHEVKNGAMSESWFARRPSLASGLYSCAARSARYSRFLNFPKPPQNLG
jgi:hypothetical protein